MRHSFLFPILVATHSFAQLTKPSPAWQPPPASSGTAASSSSQPNAQWSTLLGDLLYFYEAQRSGNLPSDNRVSWRNSSALNDAPSGGYYDAGDYVKFTYPLTFVLTSLCWGANNFGKGYDAANQTAYLDSMLRWGLDWLVAAHVNDDSLVVQIGDTDIDNDYWGGDQGIPTPRPSYQINSTHPGTDAAASAASAFAACSILYSNRTLFSSFTNTSATYSPTPASLTNTTYASTLLTHARSLYSFALSATPYQPYTTSSVPQSASSYASSSYADEVVLAALFLAAATNETSYADAASSWYANATLKGGEGALNWDSKGPALAVLGVQVEGILGRNDNVAPWRSEAERYLDDVVAQKGRGALTKGGLLYYDGDSNEASLNPALNAAMLLVSYAPLASSEAKAASYVSFALKQLSYTLGNNPMSMPYIVGVNPNSPTNPHTAIASGGNDITKIDTVPEQEAYVLYGAVVGGPDKNDRFWDIRSDWPQTEVALDYNAPLLTLTAFSLLAPSSQSPSDPFYVTLQDGAYARVKPSGTPCDPAFPCHHGGLSKGGQIAVGVVISVVGLAIIAGVWYLWHIRRRGGKAM